MEPGSRNQQSPKESKHQNPLPGEITDKQKTLNESAHDAAEKDIKQDVKFSAHSPNDDLDEGETARLGEDMSDII